MYVLLVTGGREVTDYDEVCRILDRVKLEREFDVVVHGDSGYVNWDGVAVKGVDALAGRWCVDRGVQQVKIPANWSRLGDKAGTARNKFMLDFTAPDLILAFEGGRGTANMIRQARENGYEFLCVEDIARASGTGGGSTKPADEGSTPSPSAN